MPESLLSLSRIHLFGQKVEDLKIVKSGDEGAETVRLATDEKIDVAAGAAEVDGIAVADGDRILVKDQDKGNKPHALNGIYILEAGLNWKRLVDIDDKTRVVVTEGSVNSDTSWDLRRRVEGGSTATADVDGAVNNSTNVQIDNIAGDPIIVGMSVQGPAGADFGTVATVTDANNIILSSPQTIANDAALTFHLILYSAKRVRQKGGLGHNRQLADQFDHANFAKIYGFSYEGIYYDLARPTLFLVHGKGERVSNSPLSDADALVPPFTGHDHFARAPRSSSKTGVSAADFQFGDEVYVWHYDRADYTIRMDVETGMFEDILLEAELDEESAEAFYSGSRARVSGSRARVSGSRARVSGSRARVSGSRARGRDHSD